MPGIPWRRRVPQRDATPEREVWSAPEAPGEVLTAAELWSVPAWAQLDPPRPVLETFPFTIDREFVRALPARRMPYLALETLDHRVASEAPGGIVEDFLQPSVAFGGERAAPGRPDMPLRHHGNGAGAVPDETPAVSGDQPPRPMIRFAEEADPAPLVGEPPTEEAERAPLVGEPRAESGVGHHSGELPVVRAEASQQPFAAALDVAIQRPTPLRVVSTPPPPELSALLGGADRPFSGAPRREEHHPETTGDPELRLAGDASPQHLQGAEPSADEAGDADSSEPDGPGGLPVGNEPDSDEPMTVPMETEALSETSPPTAESTPAVPLDPSAGSDPAHPGIQKLPLATPRDGRDEPSGTTGSSDSWSSPAAPFQAPTLAPGAAQSDNVVRRAGLGSPLPVLPQSAVPFQQEPQAATSSGGPQMPLARVRSEQSRQEQVGQEPFPTTAVQAVTLRDGSLSAHQLPELEDLAPSSVEVPVVVPLRLSSVEAAPTPLPPDPLTPPGSAADAVRHEVGERLNTDLSGVHVDRSPAVTARAADLEAKAFTDDHGVHLPLAAGPETSSQARGLMAHELTHAAQRLRLGNQMPDEDSPAGRRLEAEAVAMEQSIAAAPSPRPRGALSPSPLGAGSSGEGTSPSGISRMTMVARAALATVGRRRATDSPDDRTADGFGQVATYARDGRDGLPVTRPGVLMGIAPSEEATPAARIETRSESSAPGLAMPRPSESDVEMAENPAGAMRGNQMLVSAELQGEPMYNVERSLHARNAIAVDMPVVPHAPAPILPPASATPFGQPLLGFDPGIQTQPIVTGLEFGTSSAQLFGADTWTAESATVAASQTNGFASAMDSSGPSADFGGSVQRAKDTTRSKRSKRSKSSNSSESSEAVEGGPQRMDDRDVDVLVSQILPVLTYRLRSELRRERDNSGSLNGLF